MNLTVKQEKFCQKYIECGNASEAYRYVYPKSQKWTDKAVWERASVLLKNTKVLQRVDELKAKTAKRHEITKDEIIKQELEIMNADVFDYIEVKGQDVRFKDIMTLPIEKRRLVESVTINSVGAPVLKLVDKSKARDRLNKMLGFDAAQKLDVNLSGELKTTIEDSRFIEIMEKIGKK